MWLWSWVEKMIFLAFKSMMWMLLHWYVFFAMMIAMMIYEFWWKSSQEMKESRFMMGDSKKEQKIKK